VKATIFAGFVVACCASAAAGQDVKLVQSHSRELRLIHLTPAPDAIARFSGRVWVRGRIIGRWPESASKRARASPEYFLIPEPVAAASLPYFVVRDPPSFHRYRVESIQLLNGNDALGKVVGARQAKRLLEHRVDSIEAAGHFLIEGYVVGIECDAPWANARLLETRRPRHRAGATRAVPEGC